MYPTDGTNPYVRMEALDIEMKINSHYLGRDDQVSFLKMRAVGCLRLIFPDTRSVSGLFIVVGCNCVKSPSLHTFDWFNSPSSPHIHNCR